MNSIGLKKVTFFLIRHKESKQIMPLAKRNRGYSHWNPGSSDTTSISIFTEIPRILLSEKQAWKCIYQWACLPNGRRSFSQNNYTGEYDDIIDFKDDGRKKEDLEVVKVRMVKS